MEKDKFAHYLKTLSRTINIPITYATYGEVEFFQPFSLITDESDIGFIAHRLQPVFDKFPDKKVMYCITSHLVMIGIVKNKKTDELIFVEPIASDTAYILSKYMSAFTKLTYRVTFKHKPYFIYRQTACGDCRFPLLFFTELFSTRV